ncbi:hypothetical protein BKP35_09050 [Anaerobacillus arseniciselenatis]|uniref:EAL domain-containing protein n=1 Tax=Anaerobacillus arseniciselenatis TaxID=85682 RepID=A0A1S2LLJ4_9BACI|nr:EAL domain-containing protein [Anaerobacillus arseniciselenatis]OIJ13372.1 hypothetical protein BKP35_09050 [Anaerobacillus arseniciselenatis]
MLLYGGFLEKQSYYHHFQPIINLKSDKVFGYEAFIRCREYASPEQLFREVSNHHELFLLDTYSIEQAIINFSSFDHEGLLFLNVFPSTLLNKHFPKFVEKVLDNRYSLKGRIIFEINESFEEDHLWNFDALNQRINFLHQLECRVAIDDVGKGAASLQRIVELKPDFIKLDRYFSTDISKNKEKQKLVTLFTNYCNESNLIIEGIETTEDLATIKQLGVTFGQGYYLGKPKMLQVNNCEINT